MSESVREQARAIDEIRKRHKPYGIYDDCGHEHDETEAGVIEVMDIGYVCKSGLLYEVCFYCDTDDGTPYEWIEQQTWPCDAAQVLAELEPLLAAKAEAWRIADALAEALRELKGCYPLIEDRFRPYEGERFARADAALALHSEAKR